MTSPDTPAPVISASSYVLGFDNVEVTFSELIGIQSEIDAATASTTTPPHPFGTASPPTLTLTRGADGNTGIWAWHTAALEGNPAARKNCTLKLQGASGQTLLTFVLENAWPTTVTIAGLQSGASQLVLETDVFVCDAITMQPG
jgi:phage tail-like protein